MNAYEWGLKHGSCPEALEARQALGDKTQEDWWRICPRGDWLLWQLRQLPDKQLESVLPALRRAIDCIVARAIRLALRTLFGNYEPWTRDYRRWARNWLNGKDRSAESARAAAAAAAAWAAARAAWAEEAAAWAAAKAKELHRQALDIRREIPEWPGEK